MKRIFDRNLKWFGRSDAVLVTLLFLFIGLPSIIKGLVVGDYVASLVLAAFLVLLVWFAASRVAVGVGAEGVVLPRWINGVTIPWNDIDRIEWQSVRRLTRRRGVTPALVLADGRHISLWLHPNPEDEVGGF